MKISILTAVFNEEIHLSECIRSVLDQENVDFEHIIVDDFSTDRTESIAKLYASSDKRVLYFKNLKKGKVNAFNYAFQKSTGEIIAFLGGDDFLEKDTLKHRCELFIKYKIPSKTPSVFHHALRTISINPKYSMQRVPKSPKRGNISGQTTTFNRSAANLIFPIPIELPSEDCWTKLISKFLCNSYNDAEIVVNYRIHQNNSVPRDKSFEEFDNYLTKRELAYKLFLKKYPNLSIEILPFIKLSELRQRQQILRIFLAKKIPIIEKLRTIFFANPTLLKLRSKFFKLFSGW